MINKLLLLSFLILSGLSLGAQTSIEKGIVAYTTKDGLASNIVYAVVQDNVGQIWICT